MHNTIPDVHPGAYLQVRQLPKLYINLRLDEMHCSITARSIDRQEHINPSDLTDGSPVSSDLFETLWHLLRLFITPFPLIPCTASIQLTLDLPMTHSHARNRGYIFPLPSQPRISSEGSSPCRTLRALLLPLKTSIPYRLHCLHTHDRPCD